MTIPGVLMTLLSLIPSLSGLSGHCESLPGSDSVLKAGAVVLLGEIHGTAEAPEAVARLACEALEDGLAVVVGVEIPGEEEEAIDRYLEPGDEAEQRRRLLEGSFWQRDYQDGRSSRAMLELLAALRRYRLAGGEARVITFDDPAAPDGRDAFMARRLAEVSDGSPEAILLALTGNLHNRLTTGTRWDSEYRPMGHRLRELRPDLQLISLRITHSGGSAWVCNGSSASDCGIRELRGEDASSGIELAPLQDGAYSGSLHVGSVAASPPAKN